MFLLLFFAKWVLIRYRHASKVRERRVLLVTSQFFRHFFSSSSEQFFYPHTSIFYCTSLVGAREKKKHETTTENAFLTPCTIILAALKRADSSASSTKRKVSSISTSEASDHEDKGDKADKEEEKAPESPLFDVPEEGDRLEENMPWLATVAKVLNSFNFYCTHQVFCHPNCYRRQMRSAKRIMEAARQVRAKDKKVLTVIKCVPMSISTTIKTVSCSLQKTFPF